MVALLHLASRNLGLFAQHSLILDILERLVQLGRIEHLNGTRIQTPDIAALTRSVALRTLRVALNPPVDTATTKDPNKKNPRISIIKIPLAKQMSAFEAHQSMRTCICPIFKAYRTQLAQKIHFFNTAFFSDSILPRYLLGHLLWHLYPRWDRALPFYCS